MTRYFEYDYDRGVVTEYERQGECNQCGDCCRADIAISVQGLAPDTERATFMAGGPATSGAGVWQVVEDEGGLHCYQVAWVSPGTSACPSLDAAGRCGAYAERHKYCQRWPLTPADIQPFPRCGFRFVEIGAWPIASLPAQEVPA